ncbi:MAG: ankyrin repeat domain-containing protein, partial [Verrucomicrobiales bacterium]|nr:ankyrin repeat domain-containing protein [Verrucomicrobiales bacterium]
MNAERQLVVAILAGNLSEVTRLIADGVDVNSKHEDSEGYSNRTPLIYAAKSGHVAIIKALLSAGADHKAKDRYIMPSEGGGETALHHAVEGGHFDAVEALIAAGANLNAKSGSETPLMAAIRLDDARMVRFLLENGANPNVHKDGFTALGRASLDGKVTIVRTLLKMGADPDFQQPRWGTTYLMEAAERGNA